jgi:lipoprotein-releasing system permease protein
MPFELFIAIRYLLAKRKQAFISLISLISTIGVAVGVMALIVALALMTGLQGELRDRILGSMAHVYVWHNGGITDYHADVARLQQVEGVIGAAPAIDDQALLIRGETTTYISVKGIDPALEGRVTDLGRTMQSGRLQDLHDETDDEPPGILIGKDLAAKLQVAVGDRINLITPETTLTPGGLLPRAVSRVVRVAGIYALGLYEFDSTYGFISLDFAQRITRKNAPDRIQLKVDRIERAPEIARRIVQQYPNDYVTQDWTEANHQIFSALATEKLGMSLAVGLIVLVGALNIIASLILLVMEKTRDIAILKTMGTSARVIMRIFMMQGLIIGVVGTTVGAIGGVSLCWVLTRYRLVHIPEDVYQVSYIPFVVLPRDFVMVVVASVLIAFAATLYPSRQAGRLDPVQALRFE